MSEVEKYEAWAAQLESQLKAHKKLRQQVRYFPVFALLTAPIGLIWSGVACFVIALAWFSLWATTLYITSMRSWQHRIELADTYGEVERLHAAAGKAAAGEP